LVTAAKVISRDVAVEIHAPVDLRPIESAEVGSKTLGYLDAVLVDRGDRVKRGQLLALVRPSDLPDQLAAAKGSLSQAKAAADLARTNNTRNKQLAPSGVVSTQEIQQSESALAAAEAAEAAANAQLGALATRLGETRITSPFDGVVAQRRLDAGSLVGLPTSGGILVVQRIDVLRVFITVNEREAAGVSIGKDAHVELDALPGKSVWGKVVRLAPSFDPTTRTLEAEVRLENKGELRPGMYGRGAIVIETHPNVPVIPSVAEQISDRKAYVFIVAGKDQVERREIQVGVDMGDELEIVRGLSTGERVVTAGADGLSDHTKVRVSELDPYTGRPIGETKTATMTARE
jgi:RND family efflux transporter MFP subunit